MAYLSQDLQKICLDFINKKQIPGSMLKAAEKYSPRLAGLLKAKDKTVFESDLKNLANFFQNSSFSRSRQFSPNQYQKPAHVQQNFHEQLYDMQTERNLNKLKKSELKQKYIEKRLQSIHNPTGSKEMEEIIKKINIRKARDLSARQERALEYVQKLTDQKRKSGTSQNILNTIANKNKTPDTNLKTKTNYQPIKMSDLVV